MQIFFKSFSAYVHYPDDDSYEELNLKDLIRDKHVAVSESMCLRGLSFGFSIEC